MARALRCVRFQPSGVPQKRGTKSCACFLCLPHQSGSGSQELDGRTLPGCGGAFSPPRSQPQFSPVPVGCVRLLPSAPPAPVPAHAGWVPVPCVSPQPSRGNLRRSLVRNWRPVCSVVGDVVLGAEPAPFPYPPASCLRRGWAGPQPASSSGLARSLCSANSRQCVRAG